MGWRPDYPDFRDFTPEQKEVPEKYKIRGQGESIHEMLARLGVADGAKKARGPQIPGCVSLRQWCSPVEDQEDLGSCTANAGVGLVEYFERRAHGTHLDASRLFLYKATRNLAQETGDTGAQLRTTIGALVLFGVPPEEFWPYRIRDFEVEPSAFCYAFAQNYQAIRYYRLDPLDTPKDALLARIRLYLAAGLPSVFGFSVYSSIAQAGRTGKIPFPTRGERLEGGHAVMAVGYDDNIKIKNANAGGRETKGAIEIRNSWGERWGDGGYGWLSYEYILQDLAIDCWSILKNEWAETKQFGIGRNGG
jgi:C1A family cysteine protease